MTANKPRYTATTGKNQSWANFWKNRGIHCHQKISLSNKTEPKKG